MASLTSSAQAASVPLGTADSFAVLAGSTVTNTGPSVISGNLGLSPGSAVTGFPPGTVTQGTIHAADAVASQAKSDLVIAYNNAAGRSSTASVSGDLAGRTLTPGVYTSASSLGLSGDLTLDARGDPNAEFIFQAGSTLTVGSGSRVLLIGGAQACNVFWQVGSSATLGTSSAFVGSILALTSISLTTRATLFGRALARDGAVTLDTNTITRAGCANSTSTPPTATGTSATTVAGQPVTIALKGTDPTGAGPTFVITSAPKHGTLGPINQSDGTVTYTPDAGYTGTDSFSYVAISSNGTSNTATARITIRPAGGARGASARLLGPTRCVRGSFRARVKGRKIAQVTFFVDGKRRRTVRARPGRTVFSLLVNPRRQSFRAHRITARVRFTAASGAKTRTLRLVYRRCDRATVRPKFTG